MGEEQDLIEEARKDMEENEEESGDYYASCPDCDFMETEISQEDARTYQKNGCPQCRDKRGVGVAKMGGL